MSPRLSGCTSPILQSPSASAGMESVSIPTQPSRARQGRRGHDLTSPGSLTLPSLPRFHPANFPSQGSSPSNTPLSGPNSPQPPMSPRSQQKNYSEAQKQLYTYQRELLSSISRTNRSNSKKPASPRLIPVGSPGPITPLELEGESGGDYLTAGVRSYSAVHSMSRGCLADDLIYEGGATCHGKSHTSKGSRPNSGGRD